MCNTCNCIFILELSTHVDRINNDFLENTKKLYDVLRIKVSLRNYINSSMDK